MNIRPGPNFYRLGKRPEFYLIQVRKKTKVSGEKICGLPYLPGHPIIHACAVHLLFNPLDVFAGAGVYFYFIALVNKQRYFYFNAVFGGGGL